MWSKHIRITLDKPINRNQALLDASLNAFTITYNTKLFVDDSSVAKQTPKVSAISYETETSIVLSISDYILDNVVGDVVVEYDKTKGSLAGSTGSPIESFIKVFEPINLTERQQPATRETIKLLQRVNNNMDIMFTVNSSISSDTGSFNSFIVSIENALTITVSGTIKP